MVHNTDELKLITVNTNNAAQAIVGNTIHRLMQLSENWLPGSDSGLLNIWEQICVQVQGDLSLAWNDYAQLIDSSLVYAVAALAADERHALLIKAGADPEQHFKGHDTGLSGKDQSGPSEVDIIVHYLLDQLLTEAEEFDNENIRRYLEDDDGNQSVTIGRTEEEQEASI